MRRIRNSLGIMLVAAAFAALLQMQVQAQGSAPVYKPPMRGAPASRVGGGSRGAGDDAPYVAVLAPDHTGLTTKEQPTLFWFVSKPVAAKIEVTVINDQAVNPALEKTIGAPARAGIQRLRLADYGVKLQPGIEYRWHVSLVNDPAQRSNDIVASGTIQRIEPDAALRAKLAQNKDRLLHVYAEEGIWYDALEAASDFIDAHLSDRQAREQRAAMFDQVGLEAAAKFDRAGP